MHIYFFHKIFLIDILDLTLKHDIWQTTITRYPHTTNQPTNQPTSLTLAPFTLHDMNVVTEDPVWKPKQNENSKLVNSFLHHKEMLVVVKGPSITAKFK